MTRSDACLATFQVDATPPLGAPLCFGYIPPAERIVDPLTCRGVVLLIEPLPVALCAVDWLGIANGGYERWRTALAQAAGTTPQRVCVHCLHQHDAPAYDPTAAAMLDQHGLFDVAHHAAHAEDTIRRVADAVRAAVARARPITHLTCGSAKVHQVASNRRIVQADGKVHEMRGSKCTNPDLIAAPEGLIDPLARVVGFWHGDEPVACLSWYATHPQSHYAQGGVSWDFPGIARHMREQALPGVAHIHFTGCAGDVAAGKYNDGSPENRPRLAQRLADGIGRAWDDSLARRQAIDAGSFDYRVLPVHLPPTETRDRAELCLTMADESAGMRQRITAARALAWLNRCDRGDWPIDLTALRCGDVWMVGGPGELSIEYQLALHRLRPGESICMASYADYGPSYICTEDHYAQGGYEPTTSLTSPKVERVLHEAFARLLK